MNAVRIGEFGDADVLTYEEVPRPEPSAEQVLVRVHAAGINPVDYKIRNGGPPPMLTAEQLPIVVSGLSENFAFTVPGSVKDQYY